jgi:hypothetical protein
MERLLTDFNRSTENIKVFFRIDYDNSNDDDTCASQGNKINNIWRKATNYNLTGGQKQKKPSMQYSLEVCRLSPIDECVRNARGFTAEIVRLEEVEHVEAKAVLLGTTIDMVTNNRHCESSEDSESQQFASLERGLITTAVVTEIIGPDGRTQTTQRQCHYSQQEQPHHDCCLAESDDIVEATPCPTIFQTFQTPTTPIVVAVTVDRSNWIQQCQSSDADSHGCATAEVWEVSN